MKFSISMMLCLLLASSVISAGLIDISYSPYTISHPGSYIVVCDLTTGQDLTCITIETSNVTIDLNGHTLYGAGSTVGTPGYGIYGTTPQNNISVFNGTVRDFRSYGIYISGKNQQVTRIRAYTNGYTGISVGSNSRVWDNTVSDNHGDGIYCGYGNTITNNSSSYNGGFGIYVNSGCTVTGNSVLGNGSHGIRGSNGNTVTGNTAYANGADGISHVNGAQIVGNTCRFNEGAGINVTSNDNFVGQNLCVYNYGAGVVSSVAGNYFEQNKLSGNTPDESLGGSPEGAGDLANVIF
jgi:parallel beta-helix repeat protein